MEAFRALASRSLRRGLVDERPALTAHELAADLTAAFPDRAGDLVDAAALFDRVFYGHQRATAEAATAVLALDDALRTARPASRTPAGRGPAGGGAPVTALGQVRAHRRGVVVVAAVAARPRRPVRAHPRVGRHGR